MPELTFKGKVHVANHHLVVPFHELVPVKSKGLAKTPSIHDNLLIHGDNLLALKALLPTHSGKIKCIYIDPPYNTGNEGWAYNDKVNSPLMRDWLGKTIDRDDLTRHDKWCSMMLPRLKLLRELLTEDGAIFVSIDDNEVHHLRCLMDEVFGEENFVANFIWKCRKNVDSRTLNGASTDHESILCYGKTDTTKLRGQSIDISKYKNPNEDPKGPWASDNLVGLASREDRPNLHYELVNPATGIAYECPPMGWRYSKKRMASLIEEGRIIWPPKKEGRPRYKRYISDLSTHYSGQSTILTTVSTAEGTAELKEIFKGEAPIAFPKPSDFIKLLIEQIATDKDSLILDSFAGSGTTGHAVMKQNAEDGGNRRFILVETEDYADTTTAERLRRCINGVPTAKDEALKKGYGGTFSFFQLGGAVALQSILTEKNLPSYASLASYIFFTATGEQFEPSVMNPKTHFIGKSKAYDVYLIYTPDIEALKDLALDLATARALPQVKGGKERKRLVFAPTRFLDDPLLHQHGIVFSQLPYEIYERVEKTAR